MSIFCFYQFTWIISFCWIIIIAKAPSSLENHETSVLIKNTFSLQFTSSFVHCRFLSGKSIARPKVLFPRITRNDVDTNISHLIKYLFNFAFYKFGVEVTLIMVTLLITSRMDAVAVLYAFWLCILFGTSRETKYLIWPVLQFFIVILILIQYIVAVDLPPFLCVGRLNVRYLKKNLTRN